ncbi:hypothetical protein [Piscinibacter gummiphilus]|uniref:Uncharacterized protein n=1 Tax=Piscinibacter gummiphilus TaxID=946333 RepID=A0A1W6LAQ5_9BURK|nr:hypothetical protein [Piscinibacter gummiphilus]ARN21371.1 hypothetical protein A4W93_16515 [Piscinibacter gummiphilus]ATU66057.1 hypothetical protein CPZ87_16600 [Piscinibacter gummiphilus]GLS96282.1 hypothetical protein GCM10007918_35740 [Piscinibacter gummiphilus]
MSHTPQLPTWLFLVCRVSALCIFPLGCDMIFQGVEAIVSGQIRVASRAASFVAHRSLNPVVFWVSLSLFVVCGAWFMWLAVACWRGIKR